MKSINKTEIMMTATKHYNKSFVVFNERDDLLLSVKVRKSILFLNSFIIANPNPL